MEQHRYRDHYDQSGVCGGDDGKGLQGVRVSMSSTGSGRGKRRSMENVQTPQLQEQYEDIVHHEEEEEHEIPYQPPSATPHPPQQPQLLTPSTTAASTSSTSPQSAIPSHHHHPPAYPPQAQQHQPKRLRACESCRGLKVRCQPADPAAPKGACQRCTKARRKCVFTEPKRKRQRRVDSKVAELERKIDALTASLARTRREREEDEEDGADHEEDREDEEDEGMVEDEREAMEVCEEVKMEMQLSPGSDTDLSAGRGVVASVDATEVRDGGMGRLDESTHHHRPIHRPHNERPDHGPEKGPSAEPRFRDPDNGYRDIIDQGLIDFNMAQSLWNRYNDLVMPNFPVMYFTAEDTFDSIRRRKPVLFLAVMAVSSGSTNQRVYQALHAEVTKMFAERIMMNGEKSLELVQALMLMGTWYQPPERFEELKFYMLIHMAASMALDIGLGKNLSSSHPQNQVRMASADHTINKGISAAKKSISEAFKSLSTNDKASIPKSPSIHPSALPAAKPIQQLPQVASYLPDPCSLESRRTHLSCYLLASQVSVQLRRPNLLRFSTFMDESLDILESSSASCQLDRIFCQFIRLQRIAEEMAELFSFDDPMAKVSIRDPTIQRAITRFGLNLKTWRMKLKESFFTPALRLYYHATVLLCHEISLHVDHNVDDFRMPFTEQIISESSLRGTASPPTIQISAISTCAAAAQSYLDVIYETPLTELIHLPVLSFMRISYCCMVLTKIYTTVATKKSDLASIIELESLGVEGYLNRTLLKLAQASDGEKYSPAGKFSMVLIMLRTWFQNHKSTFNPTPPSPPETNVADDTASLSQTIVNAKRTPNPANSSAAQQVRASSDSRFHLQSKNAYSPSPKRPSRSNATQHDNVSEGQRPDASRLTGHPSSTDQLTRYHQDPTVYHDSASPGAPTSAHQYPHQQLLEPHPAYSPHQQHHHQQQQLPHHTSPPPSQPSPNHPHNASPLQQHYEQPLHDNDIPLTTPAYPINPIYQNENDWVMTVPGGIVEFQAGELGLGLGGVGSEFFIDDSFWRGVEWMYM